MTGGGFLLALGAISLAALLIVLYELRISRTDKHLDKLGPRALDAELRRQREERK